MNIVSFETTMTLAELKKSEYMKQGCEDCWQVRDNCVVILNNYSIRGLKEGCRVKGEWHDFGILVDAYKAGAIAAYENDKETVTLQIVPPVALS